MQFFLVLITGLALAQTKASPIEENDVVPEKKSMRSMDRTYFRDVVPWRSSYYNSWGKRSGAQDKRSMMSMDRSMVRGASSYRPSSSSWWGKRSMWSMDRANQRNAQFYKRSPNQEKQAIVSYLLGLAENNAISPEDLLALLEQIKEQSDQKEEQSQGEHGRVKRGEPFIPAMGAPSPPSSMFSRGSGMEIKRLTPTDEN